MDSQRAIRVAIVDDYDMLRKGLRAFLETCTDLDLVGEASSGDEALALVQAVPVDVLLTDLIMPGMGGAQVIARLRSSHPHIRCIALSAFSDEKTVQDAISAGAVSYLLKSVSASDLAQAIRDAWSGKSTLAREAAQVLVDAAHRPARLDTRLTLREREVLRRMARGLNNHQIAADLAITLSTVKKHVSSILVKFEVGSRTEAVALAVRHGLTE
jgi:two-component system, NarL family, response regulator LiaR